MHKSFLRYRDYRWLKISLVLSALAIVAYLVHGSNEPPNGGTWLGYTLGTVGALLIVWLTWFGVRKRNYRSNVSTVKGWLSAHVWLGLSLLVIATLHTGFQLGWNIHTLAYILMVFVIVSGLMGVGLYMLAPSKLTQTKQGRSVADMAEAIHAFDEQALRAAAAINKNVEAVIADSIARVSYPETWRERLLARDRSMVLLNADSQSSPEPTPNPCQTAVISWLALQVANSSGDEMQQFSDLMNLLRSRRDTTEAMLRSLRLQAWLAAWLYLHVPMTFALLAALTAHILSVFIYW